MKAKWIYGLLCLVLVLGMCFSASAESSAAPFHYQSDSIILSNCLLNNSVYCAEMRGICTYDLQAQVSSFYSFANHESYTTFQLFPCEGRLMAIAVLQDHSVCLLDVTFADEAVQLQKLAELDLAGIGISLDVMELCQIAAGTRYAIFTVSLNWSDMAICRMDLLTGEVRCIYETQGSGILLCPYLNGGILLQKYTPNGDGENTIEFLAVDGETGNAEALGKALFAGRYVLGNMAADCETGDIYFQEGSSLFRTNPAGDEPQMVGANVYEEERRADYSSMGYYIAYGYKSFTAIPLHSDMDGTSQLVYASDSNYPEAMQALSDENALVLRKDYSGMADRVIDMLLSRDSSVDVLILDANTETFRAIRDRGYALSLTQSDALDQASQAMYPALRTQLSSPQGELVAIPVRIYLDLPSLNQSALRQLGMSEADVPKDWQSFLNWLSVIAERMQAAQVSLFPEEVSIEAARRILAMDILQAYQLYYSQSEDKNQFTTQSLRSMLDQLMTLDYAALGQRVEAETDAGEAPAAFLMYSSYGGRTPEELMPQDEPKAVLPCVLALSPDTKPYLQYTAQVAVVNPYTTQPTLALRFVEALWSLAPAGVHYCMIPTLDTPVQRDDYEEEARQLRDQTDALAKQMESADALSRADLQIQMDSLQSSLNRLPAEQWAISREKIDWLRAHDAALVLSAASLIFDESEMNVIEPVQQYLEGYLNSEQFVARLEERMQMMLTE